MSEVTPVSPESQEKRFDVHMQYGNIAVNYLSRKNVHGYAENGAASMHDQIITEGLVDLRGDETVLDYGCGVGEEALKLRQRGHLGRIVGFDINLYQTLETRRQIEKQRLLPIEFRPIEAFGTEIEDKSADRELAILVLQHTAYEEVLPMLARKLRSDGKLLVGTDGPDNQPRRTEFTIEVAEWFGVEAPNLTATFDSTEAEKTLPRYFGKVTPHGVQNRLKIDTDTAILYYTLALYSLASACNPAIHGREWDDAVNALIVPKIEDIVRRKGQFIDAVDKWWYVCEDPLYLGPQLTNASNSDAES